MELSILWASTHTAISVYSHTHSFYQLILCQSEGGFIGLDDRLYPARAHNVYLARPGVSHSIDQCAMMQILEIKFNASGLLAQRLGKLPGQFSLANTPIQETLLERVSTEEAARTLCFDEAASCALQLFFIDAFRHFGITVPEQAAPSPDGEAKESGDTLILQLKEYIEEHLQEDLTLEQLANKVHFSKTYFVQRFKCLWGVPPMKYVSNLRCQKAKYLLVDTQLSVSEIANRTGFQSPHYFSAVFKRYAGKSPHDFRKDNQ